MGKLLKDATLSLFAGEVNSVTVVRLGDLKNTTFTEHKRTGVMSALPVGRVASLAVLEYAQVV